MARAALRMSVWIAALAVTLGAPAQAGDTGQDRFSTALAALPPQRPGVVDAYVVVAALDPTPVFGREARETGRVLARRFGEEGRTIVLANDEGGDSADASSSIDHLQRAIQHAAALMDRNEDVLVLYTTSHGAPGQGLVFRNPLGTNTIVTPAELAAMLDKPGVRNRLVILQACFAGQFVPALAGPGTVVATAASAMTSSFGCAAGNDWTFFGYALINQAMRKPDTFLRQFRRAYVSIVGWEDKAHVTPSSPQISVGKDSAGWLAALDAHAPDAAGAPVGRPPAEAAR